MDSLKARLLVATPLLGDPNFDRAVVLLLEHGDEGALGLILNRPSDLLVADPLPAWSEHAGVIPVVFVGGPVSGTTVIALASIDGSLPAGSWEPVLDSVGVLDLDVDPDLVGNRIDGIRCYAGYAGWGSGQLEDEITQGAWFVVDADPTDPFTDDPEGLWRTVLARQPGELARFALVPDDPSMN